MRVYSWPRERPKNGAKVVVIQGVPDQGVHVTEAVAQITNADSDVLAPDNVWLEGIEEYSYITTDSCCMWVYLTDLLKLMRTELKNQKLIKE